MKYEISKKNIKQSTQNLINFLNKNGIIIPRNIAFEAIAKVFFNKNWNTLEAMTDNPSQIKNYKKNKTYIIEIESNCPQKELLTFVKDSFNEGNCLFNMIDHRYNKNINYFEFDLTKNNNNIITALFILGNKIKKSKYHISRCDMVSVIIDKTSATELFK